MEIHITTTMVSITAAKKNEITIPVTTTACVTTTMQAKIAQMGKPVHGSGSSQVTRMGNLWETRENMIQRIPFSHGSHLCGSEHG